MFSEGIINIFNYLGEKFGVAIDWTSTNVVPYVEGLLGRVVNYEIATSMAWLVLSMIAILSSIIMIKKCAKTVSSCDGYEDEDKEIIGTLGCILGVILIVAGIFIVTNQVFDIVQAITLPEKTIYETIKGMGLLN